MEHEAVEISESDVHSVLIDAGVKLLAPPPTVDELLALLDDVEGLLGFLGQDPSCALKDALLPTVKGLVSDKLFRHPNMDVKISVLSCIHELLRITAPEAPYDNDIMKEIFHQTLIALEKLTLFSGCCYTKALHILETVAKVRSCLILLDIGCDALIIQMFQVLLDTIRSKHPDAVFSNMEEIMTWLIDESDELSLDLLKPLLTSVKKENQNISPLSWRLGVNVLKNCSAKVKPYLMKAVEQMRLDIENYTDIVASIWPGVIAKKNVMKEAAIDAYDIVQMLCDGTAEQNGNYKSLLVDGSSSKTLVCREKVEPIEISANESAQPETVSRRRVRKPNSTSKTKEGNKHIGVSGGKTSEEVYRKRKNYGKLGSLSKRLSLEKSPLPSKSVSLDQDSLGRGWPKMKVNNNNALAKKGVDFLSGFEMKDKTTAENCDVEESLLRSYKKSGGKEYRAELIGSRVKVWWPVDRQFYEGIVESYDPFMKKHKVAYGDGDVEILRLKRERWLLLDEQDQEANFPGSSVAPVKLEEEKADLKEHNAKQENTGLPLKKEENASASKRRSQPGKGRKCGSLSIASPAAEAILAIKNELDTTMDENDEKPLISEILRYARRPR